MSEPNPPESGDAYSGPNSPSALQSLRTLFPRLRTRARRLRQRMWGGEEEAVAERLNGIDEQFVKDGARDVTDADIQTVVDEADAIEERFRNRGPLRRVMSDGRLLLDLVQDAYEGRYRQLPVWTISAAAFTLLYVLNPFDLIPEALPVLGVLDDAAVVSACLVLIEQDLHGYREWRRQLEARAGSDGRGEGVDDEETAE